MFFKKNIILSKNSIIIYFILSISLFVGLIFGEDFGGGGSVIDYKNTFPKIENPIKNMYNYDNKFPLHYLIGSIVYFFFQNQFLYKLFFVLIAILLPLIYFQCLIIKYKNINKDHLFLLSLIILILPGVRTAAIWPNTQLTSIFFFLISIYYFLKWQNEKNKNNNNLYFFLFFMAITVYCREIYALIFLYFYFFLFRHLKFTEFIKLSIILTLFSVPGLLYLYLSPTKSITGMDLFSFEFHNTILINLSILSLYLFPYFVFTLFSKKIKLNLNINLSIFIIILTIFFLGKNFDFNHINGGGIFLKLSLLIFNNNYFFFLTSFMGALMCLILINRNFFNGLLITLIILGISGQYIFMKYFEPMFMLLFFLIINNKNIYDFLKLKKNIIFYFSYFLIYYFGSFVFTIFDLKQLIGAN